MYLRVPRAPTTLTLLRGCALSTPTRSSGWKRVRRRSKRNRLIVWFSRAKIGDLTSRKRFPRTNFILSKKGYHFTKSDERKRDFSSRFATEFFQFVFTQRALWIGCLTFWWSKPVDRFVISKLSSVSGGKHLLIKISSRCCSLLGIWSSYRLWSRNLVSLAGSSCSSKSPLGSVVYWGFDQAIDCDPETWFRLREAAAHRNLLSVLYSIGDLVKFSKLCSFFEIVIKFLQSRKKCPKLE